MATSKLYLYQQKNIGFKNEMSEIASPYKLEHANTNRKEKKKSC